MESLREKLCSVQELNEKCNEIECGSNESHEPLPEASAHPAHDEKKYLADQEYSIRRPANEDTQTLPSLYSKAKQRWRRSRGWRFGVMLAALSTSTVLLFNIIMFVTAFAIFGNDIKGGIGTGYEGQCRIVSNMATICHVIINILGKFASSINISCRVVSYWRL